MWKKLLLLLVQMHWGSLRVSCLEEFRKGLDGLESAPQHPYDKTYLL